MYCTLVGVVLDNQPSSIIYPLSMSHAVQHTQIADNFWYSMASCVLFILYYQHFTNNTKSNVVFIQDIQAQECGICILSMK